MSMKVKSLEPPHDLIVWNLQKFDLKPKALCRSNRQYDVGQFLTTRYPLDTVLEDVTIPGTRLSLDFYIPQRKIAVEVQGEQHDSYNAWYHGGKRGNFAKQQQRDSDKELFCELNRIKLIKVANVKELMELYD